MKKHTKYVTHIDFSEDEHGKFLKSNCGNYELLFWNCEEAKLIPKPNELKELRDQKWLTMTTPLSWHTQGVWPEIQSDTYDVNTVDRSNKTFSELETPPDNYHLLAIGDDKSEVKVYRYPTINKKSEYLLGKGHSSFISKVRWTCDDRYLISIGGEDNSIFVWKLNKFLSKNLD